MPTDPYVPEHGGFGYVHFRSTRGEIRFSAASYSVYGGSNAQIVIQRVASSAGPASVDYTTSDVTAIAGSDYIATSGSLSFADGDSEEKTFEVPIPAITFLDADNSATDILLSDNYHVAESATTAGGGVVLNTVGKTSGLFYAEAEIIGSWSSDESIGFGLKRGTTGLSAYVGQNTDSWGVWRDGFSGGRTYTYFNGSNTIRQIGNGAVVGAVFRMAVDIGNGYLWLADSNHNAGAWIGGGDPASGTSPTYTFNPDGATYYIALCPRRGSPTDVNNRGKLRLRSQSEFTFLLPDGAQPWLPSSVTFDVALSNPTGAIVGSPAKATVTINA